MAVQLLFTPNYAFADGEFAPGALATFFLSGTTTPAIVYADEELTTPLPSPLVADAAGRFPLAWGQDAANFKVVVTDAQGASFYTIDKVILGNVQLGRAQDISFQPVAGNSATNVQEAIDNISGATETDSIADGAVTSEKIVESVNLTGAPTAATPAAGTDTTQIATTAFVGDAIDGVISSGTWTPSIEDAAGNVPDTVGNIEGTWLRVGNYVTLFFNTAVFQVGTQNSSTPIRLANTGFEASASDPYLGVAPVLHTNLAGTGRSVVAHVGLDGSDVVIFLSRDGDDGGEEISYSDYGSTASLRAIGSVSFITTTPATVSPIGTPTGELRTGNVTVSSSSDLEFALNNHDGNGQITVVNGNYTMTGLIQPIAARLDVEAENLGGATIEGNWRFNQGTGARLVGLNLEPLDNADFWLRSLGANIIEFEDTKFDGPNITADQLGFFKQAFVTMRARDRDCTFTMGPNCREGLDMEGSFLKTVGNINAGNMVILTMAATANSHALLTLQQTNAVFAGVELRCTNTGNNRGIDLARGSTATFQDDVGGLVSGFDRGIIARDISRVGIRDAFTASNNNIVFSIQHGGEIAYISEEATFTSNTTLSSRIADGTWTEVSV